MYVFYFDVQKIDTHIEMYTTEHRTRDVQHSVSIVYGFVRQVDKEASYEIVDAWT